MPGSLDNPHTTDMRSNLSPTDASHACARFVSADVDRSILGDKISCQQPVLCREADS
jgi:hypothetical protein